MTTFRVGQRVRIVNHRDRPKFLNKEATVAAIPGVNAAFPDHYGLYVDGIPPVDCHMGMWWASSEYLAPLTDPAADAFLESIKKLKPYEEPLVVKVKA